MSKVAMIMKYFQESKTCKAQQQRLIGSAMRELLIIRENIRKEMSKFQEEESDEDEEESEENSSERKNEDDTPIIEEDQEECPLMDMSNKEQENQEASKEELKSEMSISKPLNSSIYTLYDNDASIDFILPLDSFDHKKEVENSMGILEQNRREWNEMLRSFVEKKLCIKDEGD
ncbi:hypothetical protein ACS0TY_003010 [Phlomoides rotata]